MKEEIKYLKTSTVSQRFKSIYKTMLSIVWKVEKIKKANEKSCKDK